MPNALAHETSPYLLQHQNNPVNWMPWGPTAIEKARAENKPIFLSIGYAACHWCHVMEHESFEDPELAAVLNKGFVSIKVDREERPDLDEIYMTATMVFSGGHGGWPMSVFLAPDLRPIFAGTYFPRDDMHGRPGFRTILAAIEKRWAQDPDALLQDADKVVEVIRQHHDAGSPGSAVTAEKIRNGAEGVLRAFDRTLGGISSGSNKFPPAQAMDLFLREHARGGSPAFLSATELTLEKMADGGIYDHLGGGLHRYSTDPKWLVPHFEKMLYDQALVAAIYAEGWQATERPRLKKKFEDRARGICDYVLRDLTSPEGGFYSSEDADSEGLEGLFYIWTKDEVEQVLGDERVAKLFCSHYDVSDFGNWLHPGDNHVPAGAKNILQVVRPLETIAQIEQAPIEEIEGLMADARSKLLEVRGKRTRPGLDDKILSGWNGLMIGALAKVGAVFGEPRYVQAAERAADFVLDHMAADGRLLAASGKGEARLTAYSSDYAYLIDGLLELYQATGDFGRVRQAEQLADTLHRHYWDSAAGAYFFTADDHEELLVRSKTAIDGAVPSANSVMAGALPKLAALLGRVDFHASAEEILLLFGSTAVQQPFQAERLLANATALVDGLTELVVVGSPADDLLAQARNQYVPNLLTAVVDEGVDLPGPLFEGRSAMHGAPTAYLCRNFVCDQPVTDAAVLGEKLKAVSTFAPR